MKLRELLYQLLNENKWAIQGIIVLYVICECRPTQATLGMGTVNVAMTFVSLALIDIAGRDGRVYSF